MTTPSSPPPEPQDAVLQDIAEEGERPSITEVNGTVARFEMAYAPDETERHPFGPPLLARIPSMVYLLFAVGIVAVVAIAHGSGSNSRLYVWVVEGDRGRPLPSHVLAFLVFISGVATVIRTHMRGVVVNKDGVEARYLLPMGLPRVKKWAWAQIHRMVMSDDAEVMLELWDGVYERLPAVSKRRDLAALLEHMAQRHGIAVTHLASLEH